MAQLVDTSVPIALERQRIDLDALVQMLPDERIALAAISASELLVGVHRADTDERRARRQAFVDQVLEVLPVITFDLSVARVYAELLATLRSSGRIPGAHDLQIMAHRSQAATDFLTGNNGASHVAFIQRAPQRRQSRTIDAPK